MTMHLPHIEQIGRVLAVLDDGTDDSPRGPAFGLVVLEDVAVALHLGLQLGLSLPQIRRQHEALLAEARENKL